MLRHLYFDFAAATPTDVAVQKAMAEASADFSNPTAQYASARCAAEILQNARRACAHFLQSKAEEVIFTSGATESNNLAILGIARRVAKGKIIVLAGEHASVDGPLKRLEQEGFNLAVCPVNSKGKIELEEFKGLLSKDTVLVTVSYANGETGTVQPLTKISGVIKKFNIENGSDIKLHTDASAAGLTLPCDVARLGVDALTIGSAKIYGPKGGGLLYLKRGVFIEPLQYGGGQQAGLRPGTEAVDIACGTAKALEITIKRRHQDHRHFMELHQYFLDSLKNYKVDFIYNGHPKDRLYQIVSIVLPANSGEEMVARLDARGIEVATGAACAASEEQPSAALLSLGLSTDQAQSSLRISFGRSTKAHELDQLARAISAIIQPK